MPEPEHRADLAMATFDDGVDARMVCQRRTGGSRCRVQTDRRGFGDERIVNDPGSGVRANYDTTLSALGAHVTCITA
jgi:hypothetical protein